MEQAHYANVVEGTFTVTTHFPNGQSSSTIYNIDVAIYEENFWQHLVSEHTIWTLPFCYLERLEPSLHQTVRYKETKKFEFELRLLKLKKEVINDQCKNLEYAKRFWIKNNQIRRAKKRVVYVLQHVEFAIQLAHRSEIYDLYVGTKYHNEIMNKEFNDWEEVEKWFNPIIIELIHQLRNYCNLYRTYNPSSDSRHCSTLLGLLNIIPVEKLTLYTSVRVTKVDPKISCLNANIGKLAGELFQLHCDIKESPLEAKFIRECNGTVVEKTVHQGKVSGIISDIPDVVYFKVVAFTQAMSFDYSEMDHTDYGLNWKSFTVRELYEGPHVTVYYYANAWWVSAQNMDASLKEYFEGIDVCEEDKDKCFLFVVTEDKKIVLVCVRNMTLGLEEPLEVYAEKYNWKVSSIASISSNKGYQHVIEGCRLESLKKSPFSHCGFTIIDAEYKKLNVHSPVYLLLQQIKLDHEDLLNKYLLFIVRVIGSNTLYEQDFLTLYPKLACAYGEVKRKLTDFCNHNDNAYLLIRHVEHEKQFAELAKKSKGFNAMFAIRKQLTENTWTFYCTPSTLMDIKTTRSLESHLYPGSAKISATTVLPLSSQYQSQNKES